MLKRTVWRVMAACVAAAMMAGCCGARCENGDPSGIERLREELWTMADEAPGTVGIAFVGPEDTVTVNNGVRFPLMSVVKLHQALAAAHALETRGESFDKVLHIVADSLDSTTWSPMLKKYGQKQWDMTVGELMAYAVTSSDNNASNILFERVASPADTHAFIRTIAPDTTFNIAYSEAQMKADHALSYLNYSSPLSCALLIGKVFTDSVISQEHTRAVTEALLATTTGQDRIGAPLSGHDDVRFAHKTGSGYRNAAGELIAFNDVAYITLPDGRSYSLAVMIRDYAGSEESAAALMAAISRAVYRHMERKELGD